MGSIDYSTLREEALRQLERLAGHQWTDFNTHDPGITILEQLCYVLSDLGYRSEHEMQDLLSSGGRDPYAALRPPHEMLTTRAVTPDDLRKQLIDAPGVKNAWIEPPEEDEIALHYHPGRKVINQRAEPPASEPVVLKGLHRVLVETSDLEDLGGSTVLAEAARRLHFNRNLCEDFASIQVLRPQDVQIHAVVEIEAVEDAHDLLARIYGALAQLISPELPIRNMDEMLSRGVAMDEIFDGPLLENGFIEDADLHAAVRRSILQKSQVVHAIMDVEGVRGVPRITFQPDDDREQWALTLNPDLAARLSIDGSQIELRRAGQPVTIDRLEASRIYYERSMGTYSSSGLGAHVVPQGRDRNVGRYHSVQHHFPMLYGIGAYGLPDSAPPESKARALQLKAYLLLFDQLLADEFAQLAHVSELFSVHAHPHSYVAGRVDDPSLGLDEVWTDGPDVQNLLEEASASGPGSAIERRNRFLNHLLARFAEEFIDSALLIAEPGGGTGDGDAAADKLIHDKQAFLKRYPKHSAGRGTGFNYLEAPGAENRSGLEERVRSKLGLRPEEETILIEHILLRPIGEDRIQDVPLLSDATSADPFSLQLSFVFREISISSGKSETTPLRDERFRSFAARTVRQETPAHLTPYVRWLGENDWQELERAWSQWLERRQHYWKNALNLMG